MPKLMRTDSRIFKTYVFSYFILKLGGFIKIPRSEPIQLNLEELFLLSISKENVDFRRKYREFDFRQITFFLFFFFFFFFSFFVFFWPPEG